MPSTAGQDESVRIRLGSALVLTLSVPLGFAACTSAATTPPAPTSDSGQALDTTADAPPFPIDAALRDGPYGAWYTPAAIPSGPCAATQPPIELNVNPCCNEPDTPELARYRCECASGTWTCKVLWSGAGLCRDATVENHWNTWTPACEADGG